MLRSVEIKNYKSIVDDTIELGRINVFIGENGCGKTNILEALALVSCALVGRSDQEDLYNRGIRLARPSLMRSSFRGSTPAHHYRINTEYEVDPSRCFGIKTTWPTTNTAGSHLTLGLDAGFELVGPTLGDSPESDFDEVTADVEKVFGDFVIYNLNVLALRGLEVTSRRTPLGIHGEGLDTLIATFGGDDLEALSERARCVSWLDHLELDRADARKYQGFKLGRSHSTLYFADRYMAADNNVFSAENANEGILHVLFYLALFMSAETPAIFGIDNVETALNPLLCRNLIKELAALARERDKQALITTHNPAILDGLNLHDNDQRLFVVYRDDDGHTRTRRIRLKPDVGEPLRLSELWMRGHLGGLPQGF